MCISSGSDVEVMHAAWRRRLQVLQRVACLFGWTGFFSWVAPQAPETRSGALRAAPELLCCESW
jgi:hypothetical protein